MSHELWRPDEVSYDSFVSHLDRAGALPTYLPWPLRPGWAVVDFGVAGTPAGTPAGTTAATTAEERAAAVATLSVVSGPSQIDGPVDLLLIAEEAGVGLGARFAGTPNADPGPGLEDDPPAARIRIGSQLVPLWPVSTAAAQGEWDRSVLAGEAAGRWLWVVVRPAAALLMLQDGWELRDVSTLGPSLLELPFDGSHPRW